VSVMALRRALFLSSPPPPPNRMFWRRNCLLGGYGLHQSWPLTHSHTSQAAACGLFIKSSSSAQDGRQTRGKELRRADGYDESESAGREREREREREVLHHMLLSAADGLSAPTDCRWLTRRLTGSPFISSPALSRRAAAHLLPLS
jgi:hypothetical protein